MSLVASSADLGPIRALLEASGLPTSDLASAAPEFVVFRHAGQIVAAGALEHFGSAALLRSVVVAPDQRSRGLGRHITCELERLAQNSGVTELFLLTQTASDFFKRQGYRVSSEVRHRWRFSRAPSFAPSAQALPRAWRRA